MAHWTEKRPSEDFYRILAPDGTLEDDPPDLGDDELRRFYRTFVLTRRYEETTFKMQRRGELSLVALARGEEATPLGSAAALSPGDWCFPYYRQSPARIYWGYPLSRMIAVRGGFEPETIDRHLPAGDVPVNFTPDYTPLAVNVTNAAGSAMADAFNDRDTVSMAYVGDGSTSEDSFHDGMNFAGVFEAPLVTICQNNQWAISVPAYRQTAAETFAQKAEAYGMPHERVDGNDVLAVYEKTREAVDRAREGGGPTFIECVTYRMGSHNTADAAEVYRDEDELEYWAERDPVDRFETYLRNEGLLDDETKAEIEAEAEDRVAEAVERVRDVPNSDPMLMFEHQLHELTWQQRHQRAELAAELRGENPFTDFTGEGVE